MDVEELANELKNMSKDAPKGELSAITLLFGIKYARELEGRPLKFLALLAGRGESIATEIYKGKKLARYVDIKTEAQVELSNPTWPNAGLEKRRRR